MSELSVKDLRRETKELISALMNPKKIIPNEKGFSRDWYGLAELCGITGEKIPNIERVSDPTLKVLEIWSDKNRNDSTVGKLLSFLEELDRFDVVDDIAPLIAKDEEYHRANPNDHNIIIEDIDDKDIITYDDAERKRNGLPPQTYDAYVLYDDDDIGFATEVIKTMETQYNLKLCVKERDVVGGDYYHDSVIRLISKRCNRVIVVVSPSFLSSPMNKYFYTLAQMDGIEKQRRKIIPCLYKKCNELPLEFRGYHILDYTRSEVIFGSFWDQLHKSLKVIHSPVQRIAASSCVSSRKNDNQVNDTQVPKSTNVKFAMLDNPPEIKNEPNSLSNVANSTGKVESSQVDSRLVLPSSCESHIKKQSSFLKKCSKILNKKIKNDEEVPQINDLIPKKRKFWKSKKIKVAN